MKKNIPAILLCIVGMAFVSEAFAQTSGGSDSIATAATELAKYFEPAVKLMYVIGALLGIVGGIKVYTKWNRGDHDTIKVATSWFGSCIFLLIVATVLKGFFLTA